MLDLTTSEGLIQLIGCAGEDARSYSGRGMYGKYCVSVTCDDAKKLLSDMLTALIEEMYFADIVTLEDAEEHLAAFAKLQRHWEEDSMGRDRTIVYWKRFDWPEDAESDDEDEENDE